MLVTSEDGRPNLRALLGQLGSDVTAVPAYRHRRRYPTHPLGPIDLVVLPSSSAARHLLQSFPLADRPTVAIGPQTASAARNLGARHVVLAQTDTVEAVIERALHELRSADRLSAKPR